mgnify:CR=1 FL=1
MAINIERLLKLTADYHNFCSEDCAKANADPDELSMDELDFVAAAAAVPVEEQEPESKKLIP